MAETEGADTFGGRFRQLQMAQKRRSGVPLYTLCVNRPAGRAIAAASAGWVTPNHLTLVGAALTYGSLVWLTFVATGGPLSALVGVALIVGFFFDSADGQLARLRKSGSSRGEWLDHVLDSGRIALLHLAALCFLLRTVPAHAQLAAVVCGVFLVSAVLVFFGGILFDKLAPPSTPAGETRSASSSLRRSALMLPLDYGVVCCAFVLTAWPTVFFVVYGLLALAKVLASGAFLATWYARLKKFDLAPPPLLVDEPT